MSPDITIEARALWRRLDVPGHDAAELSKLADGYRVTGVALFVEDTPSCLRYDVECDLAWVTTRARVRGWRGDEDVRVDIDVDAAGVWHVNGVPSPSVSGCIDVDLNFTPATNVLSIRRLRLDRTNEATIRSAWLQWPSMTLAPLVQRYRWKGNGVIDYEADLETSLFRADLIVDAAGMVVKYGELWEPETSSR